ncbi:hypothetical protein DET54_108108 [Paenibacillus pabuli]|uniref:ApeA N-terminal domain-containing protein n=1 Tax=Paenibacillus pabuli TaxID=1472 RepID=A0ABX9BIC4_9BACL|nr:hypothetical protein [Paenibacillus pabuli]RAI94308.1 hypothetical protein DET54_108108 [Paenibacillus pabuli]
MVLQIKTSQEEDLFVADVTYNPEQSCFIVKCISNVKQHEVEFFLDYVLNPDQLYRLEDYTIHIFYNHNYIENNIFQVCESEIDKRIGWIFPMQALVSIEHDYSDNIHFLRYAFVAFQKLLNDQSDCGIKKVPITNERTISLFDFYPQDSFVLITCNEITEKIPDFNIENYYASLYSQGLHATKGDYVRQITNDGEKKLHVRSISDHVKSEGFLTQLFKELLNNEKHPLVRFYLLYQAIELLIEKIFNREIIDLIDEVSKQTNNLFKLKEKLGGLANEKERVGKLFNQYTSSLGSKEIVMNYCNELLNLVGRESKKNAPDALYNVRNLLVHDYRSIPSVDHPLIEQINEAFETLVVEFLLEITL